jgi:hypothetical protein
MLAIGLLSSWLGTLCWNRASSLLPTSLAGQLIVFETLAALSYAFWLRGHWPEPLTLAGIALQHMQGWPTQHSQVANAEVANAKSREVALSLGAND